MKKVAVLLAEGFETIEALTTVDVLRRAGIQCDTFALENLQVTTSHKVQVKADRLLKDMNAEEYDVVVLPGGIPGAVNLKNDRRVIELVKKFNENKKYVCAICAGPIVLGEAKILDGKNATCYPGFENQLGNCNYKEQLVVVEDNIITGRGPAAAIPFAFEILSKVKPEKVSEIRKAMLFE